MSLRTATRTRHLMFLTSRARLYKKGLLREESSMVSLRRTRFAAVWIVLLTLLPSLARAQSVAASITGLVADQTGAALPGVTITAKNQSTDVPYVTTSNETGNYTIASLPVGTYVVTAELAGFRTVTTNPVTLEAKQV